VLCVSIHFTTLTSTIFDFRLKVAQSIENQPDKLFNIHLLQCTFSLMQLGRITSRHCAKKIWPIWIWLKSKITLQFYRVLNQLTRHLQLNYFSLNLDFLQKLYLYKTNNDLDSSKFDSFTAWRLFRQTHKRSFFSKISFV